MLPNEAHVRAQLGDELVDDNADAAEEDDLRVVALPRLTEDVLLDEDALDIILAEVVGVSSAARDMLAEIERQHDELGVRLPPVDFEAVVRLERMYQARLAVVAPILAAWAWSEGVTHGQEAT